MLGIVIAAAGLLSAAPATQGQEPERVTYKQTPQGELHLHLFLPEDVPPDQKVPAIVFFFGGGWVGGSPGQFIPHAQHFAQLGMAAASAEYRIKSKHGTSPFECVEDGKSAVRWLRANADKYNIDPDRIVAGGGSAGGHVAACTGTIDGFEAENEDKAISSVPNAMVLFNPVADTTFRGYGTKKLGGREEEVSPVHHVDGDVPPAIIFHGTADETVPFDNVERFRDAMKAAGNRCELVPFEGMGHGFFNKGRKNGAYEETLEKTEEFLADVGILEPQAAE